MADEDELSRFLARFPNKVYHEPTGSDLNKRRVFFSLIEGIHDTQSNSSSFHNVHRACWILHKRIKSAFIKFNNRCPHKKGVFVQFWGPRKITNGRWTLSTLDEPFVLDHLDPRRQEYRLWCIDDENVSDPDSQTAYIPIVNAFPDVLMTLEPYRGVPLVDKAVECGFTCQIMMHVYFQTACKTKSSCVGVIECCLDLVSCLLEVFKEFRSGVEAFYINNCYLQLTCCCAHCVMSRRPETNPGLEAAKYEIKEALQTVCKLNHLALAQLWIPHDVDHFPPPLHFPKEEEEKIPST